MNRIFSIFLLLPLMAALSSCATSGGKSGNANVPAAPQPGSATTVHETIVVAAGKTFDGGGKAYKAGKEVGDGSQDEGQDPIFLLEPGATLRNLVIIKPAADGVHIEAAEGKTTRVENVVWTDVGEDAFTVISGNNKSKVELRKCGFYKAEDKVGQVNSSAVTLIKDCWAKDFGRFARSNGAHGPEDPLAYRITVDGGDFQDGAAILKMSSPHAIGSVSGIRTTDVTRITYPEHGAKITTD